VCGLLESRDQQECEGLNLCVDSWSQGTPSWVISGARVYRRLLIKSVVFWRPGRLGAGGQGTNWFVRAGASAVTSGVKGPTRLQESKD